MLDRKQIISAYQLILGREPESEAIIQFVSQARDLDALAMQLFASDEFRLRVATGALPPSSQKWVCAEIRHGLRLWVDLLDAGVGAGALRNDWETDETSFVMSQLGQGDCFVDIGANIGWFTILAAHKVGKSGLVHAFEPRSDLIGRIDDSVRANGFEGRCVLHRMALGEKDDDMILASVPAERNPGHSFLMPAEAVDGAVPLMTVPVRRLDDITLSLPVKLIKLDVEGAEAMVVGGAKELLARDKPIVVTEFFPQWLRAVSQVEPQTYLDLYRDTGYRLFYLGANGPGDAVETVPDGADRPDFSFNLVALPEGKPHPVRALPVSDEGAEKGASSTALREYIEPAVWRQRLGELSTLNAGWRHQVYDLSSELDREKQQHDLAKSREQAAAVRADQLVDLNAQLTQTIDTLLNELSDARNNATLLSAERAQIGAEHDELSHHLAALVAQHDDLNNRHGSLLVERDELSHRLAALVTQHDDLNNRHGSLLVERDELSHRLAALVTQHDDLNNRHGSLLAEYEEIAERAKFEEIQGRQSRQQIVHLRDMLDAIEYSTIWKMSWPMRAAGSRLPAALRANFARAARLAWWTATLQLSRRLRERAARRASLRLPAAQSEVRGVAVASAGVPKVVVEAEQPIVVIIDDRWPEPDRDSGSLDAVNMIESFVAFGYKVIFAVQTTLVQDRKYIDGLRALGAHPLTESDATSVQSFIENSADSITLFVLNRVGSGGQFLELIRYNCRDAKIIFNTVDLHHIREARMARLAGDTEALAQAERTRDREEFLAGRSDLTIVVSSVEKEILDASVPGTRVITLPLARAIHPASTPFEKRSAIGFVGGFAHQPNVDAVRYFLSDVWPLVRQADASIHFEIVGAGLPEDLIPKADENVIYRGALDSLDEWFEGLRITVAPLRVGAGAKGKVASSLCAGLPCVVSPVAAEAWVSRTESRFSSVVLLRRWLPRSSSCIMTGICGRQCHGKGWCWPKPPIRRPRSAVDCARG